jgi:hypothetical protein
LPLNLSQVRVDKFPMHSWLFRNRRRLMALYGLRKQDETLKASETDSWDGGLVEPRPLLKRLDNDQVVLFPAVRHREFRKTA